MKKVIILFAVCLMAIPAFSQNTTRIGAAHKVDFGGYLAMATGYTHWTGAAIIDINSENNNGRLGINLGWLQRNKIGSYVSAEYQYLLGKEDGVFYVYPTAGVYGQYFDHDDCGKYSAGVQAGLGFDLQFSENFAFFAEGVYQFLFLKDKANDKDINRPRVSAGIRFGF